MTQYCKKIIKQGRFRNRHCGNALPCTLHAEESQEDK